MTLFGTYADKLVKTRDGWRFKERVFRADTWRGAAAWLPDAMIHSESGITARSSGLMRSQMNWICPTGAQAAEDSTTGSAAGPAAGSGAGSGVPQPTRTIQTSRRASVAIAS